MDGVVITTPLCLKRNCAFDFSSQRHCYCDVIYSPHATLSEGPYAWLINNIERAEKIILIDSFGATEEADIHLKHSSRTRHDLGPEGLLFSLALKHIFIKSMDAVIPIHFDKERCSKYLLKPHCYKIPEELPMFLKELHSLDGKMASTGIYTVSSIFFLYIHLGMF